MKCRNVYFLLVCCLLCACGNSDSEKNTTRPLEEADRLKKLENDNALALISDSTTTDTIDLDTLSPPLPKQYVCYFNMDSEKVGNAMIGMVHQFGNDSIPGIYEDSSFYIYSSDPWLTRIQPLAYPNKNYSPKLSEFKAKVDSIRYGNNGNFSNIRVYFKTNTSLQSGSAGIISNQPFPEQNWKMIRPTKNDTGFYLRHQGIEKSVFRRLDILETPRGRFMIGQYDTGSDGEFDEHKVVIYEKTEAGWKSRARFTGQWNVPFLDVDGDGIPELWTSIGYKAPALRKWHPEIKTFAVMESGI